MRTTGIRGSSIPSRNVWCATVAHSGPQIPRPGFLIDAVTDIADATHQALDHVLSSLRPNCPRPTIGWDSWPSPVLRRLSWMWRRSRNGHGSVCVTRVDHEGIAPGSRGGLARERMHAFTSRPGLTPRCESAPLSGRRVQHQFACSGTLLIWRRPLPAAPTSENVTSGDHSGASRTKITAHPTS